MIILLKPETTEHGMIRLNTGMAGLFRNRYYSYEPLWQLQTAMVVALLLQLLLPDRYTLISRYALVLVEIILLVALSFTTPKESIFRSLSRRVNVLFLIGLTGIANSYSLFEVAQRLLASGKIEDGRELILAAINMYLTNIIIFGVFYWEMDAGGPGQRAQAPKHAQDFLFPQNQNESYKHPAWQPTFFDYLYLSATNAMAFSPTDTMPLSRRAKLLMLFQATISLIAVGLVAARAVNILN